MLRPGPETVFSGRSGRPLEVGSVPAVAPAAPVTIAAAAAAAATAAYPNANATTASASVMMAATATVAAATVATTSAADMRVAAPTTIGFHLSPIDVGERLPVSIEHFVAPWNLLELAAWIKLAV